MFWFISFERVVLFSKNPVGLFTGLFILDKIYIHCLKVKSYLKIEY